MSLLCLNGTDTALLARSFTPDALQKLMARVFCSLSQDSDPASPASYAPHRSSISTPNHTILFMPARIERPVGLLGTSIKVVSVPSSPADKRGLPASTLVMDEGTGAVKAIVNAAGLTALRNAAGSLLSCTLMGPEEPRNIVAFGAGAQISAHLDVFLRAYSTLTTCTVVNRATNDRARTLVDELRQRFSHVEIHLQQHETSSDPPSDAIRETLLAADVIICATSSQIPLFPSSLVRDGTHLILIGSYKPEMHEVDRDLIRRALPHDLVVDSREACLKEAGELIDAGIQGSEVVEIGELIPLDENGEPQLVRKRGPAQTSQSVTIFKSVGIGLQDVAIACAVVKRAENMSVGQIIPWL
ncbi:unnamed protein product [Mycena citricolor]|uniref:Ornithine cyclodeaminase n=1 Tax=Mycena citricolor TaxID=2018698 RepID=A0AAD2HF34_9AGAR|nr:unnamed protein product [Mycena citricolor]